MSQPLSLSADDSEQECLGAFKKLIDDELNELNHLKMDEETLLLLLRARRCRPEASLKLLKSLIDYKTEVYPELFQNVNPETIRPVLEKQIIGVVKRPNDVGPAVFIFRTDRWDTAVVTFDQLVLAGFMYAYEVARKSVEIQRKGIVMLIDVEGFGFSHARQSTYGNVTKMANCIIFGSPFRILSSVVVRSPFVFEKVYQVVKFAIPERYRQYVMVTKTDFSSIHKLVSPEFLPESLGGTIPEEEGWELGIEKLIWEENAASAFLEKICISSKSDKL